MRTSFFVLGLIAIASATECPDGWINTREADEHRCYRFVEEPETWEKARDMCRMAKGDLLSILSENEKEWMFVKLDDYSARKSKPIWQWWSGLHLSDSSDNWAWSDGTHTLDELIMWQPHQPDQATDEEKCGELHRTGMNDNDCSTAFAYICAKDKSQPSSPCNFGEVELGGECTNPSPKVSSKMAPGTVQPGVEPSQGACAEGWVESPTIEDRCYRFEKESHAWLDAKSLCEFAHSSLLNLRNVEEKVWIRSQIQRLGQDSSSWFGLYNEPARPSWWIGLHKMDRFSMNIRDKRMNIRHKRFITRNGRSRWAWTDGQKPEDYLIDWQSGEPNEHGNENCAELHTLGFNDNSCSTKFPFICARPKTYVPQNDCAFGERQVDGTCVTYVAGQDIVSTPASSHMPEQGDCPDGWESSSEIPDRCYRFEKEMKLDWEHARQMCQSARGELLSFRSVQEKDWVKKVVSGTSFPSSWWSGLNRLSSDNTWRWSDGSSLTQENMLWQPNEPNNELEQCGELYRTGGMNDNGCWKKKNFICVRDKDLYKEVIECAFGKVLMGRLCENLQFPTPAPLPAGSCTDGWIEGTVTPGTCYRFVQEDASMTDAKRMCRAAEGDLVSIKSDVEKEWLQQQVKKEALLHGNWDFYIGLEFADNKWQWFDGTEVPDISAVLKGSNNAGSCSTIIPSGIQRNQCWSSKPYICSRPAELDSDVHVCPWGQIWKDEQCQQHELYNTHTRAGYVESMSVNDVQDRVHRLKGKHDREIKALTEDLATKFDGLNRRIELLERALNMRHTTSDRPIYDFDPSLTLIISHLPRDIDADSMAVVRRLFTDVLGLPDVEVIHASRYGGKGRNPVKIKVLMADVEGKRTVMAAWKKAKSDVTNEYRNIRIVVAPMRLKQGRQ